VLIAAHGNSLRALVKYLDNMSDADIMALNIPTGIYAIFATSVDCFMLLGRNFNITGRHVQKPWITNMQFRTKCAVAKTEKFQPKMFAVVS